MTSSAAGHCRSFFRLSAAAAMAVALSLGVVLPSLADSPYTLNWIRQYGSNNDDYGTAVTTGTGNVYVAGYTSGNMVNGGGSHGGVDAFLCRYDALGNRLWTVETGTTSDEAHAAVAAEASGNVYLAGYTGGGMINGGGNHGGVDAFLAKYDSSGNRLSIVEPGTTAEDRATGVAVDASGSVYLAGYTGGGMINGGGNHGGADAFLAKYDASGNQSWIVEPGTTATDHATSVTVDASGNVYLAGYTSGGMINGGGNHGGVDAFLAKYDSSGNQLWIVEPGTTATDSASAVAVDASGNVYLAGYTGGSIVNGGGNHGGADAFLAKYDAAGNRIWIVEPGSTADDGAAGVTVDASGNVCLVGYTKGNMISGGGSHGGMDAFVSQYDASGNMLWVLEPGSTADDGTAGVAVDASGNLCVLGYTGGNMINGGGSYSGEDFFLQNYSPEPATLSLLALGGALVRGGGGRRSGKGSM